MIEPKRCKIHLACWNGIRNPLDVYFEGWFDSWQAVQSQKNFKREMVVALIALPEPDRWLFAGVHDVHGFNPFISKKGSELYQYSTSRRSATEELCGRLVVDFHRTGRQSYLVGERWEMDMKVAQIRSEPLKVIEFPGYTKTMLSKQHLDIIVKQQNPSWKSALSSVKGVYVIADRKNGKLYIGSATGEDGIWGRWCAYAKTGHGGNKELKELLKAEGKEHADHFNFGVLETADTRGTEQDILERESHWKELLLTRSHGYNAN